MSSRSEGRDDLAFILVMWAHVWSQGFVTDLVSKCLYGLRGYCVSAVQRVNTEAPRCPRRAHSAEAEIRGRPSAQDLGQHVGAQEEGPRPRQEAPRGKKAGAGT